MKIAQPIPYQGSKRNIANYILSFFPYEFDTLIEPFAGSSAVSIAAACHGKASRFHINDINKPLMDLWDDIINSPEKLSESYEILWHQQTGREREYYNFIRSQFNETKRTDCFLYLLARCVKASIRYNSKGEFNQSPDNRRKGRSPKAMREDIFTVSNLLRGRTIITSKDYREILKSVSKTQLIYMDPPYQGVCGNRDQRYYSGIDFIEFLEQLNELAKRRIPFILSYDGRKDQIIYGQNIPDEIGLYKVEVRAGRSTQSTLLGRNSVTYESIYLSRELISKLGVSPKEIVGSLRHKEPQLSLPIVEI